MHTVDALQIRFAFFIALFVQSLCANQLWADYQSHSYVYIWDGFFAIALFVGWKIVYTIDAGDSPFVEDIGDIFCLNLLQKGVFIATYLSSAPALAHTAKFMVYITATNCVLFTLYCARCVWVVPVSWPVFGPLGIFRRLVGGKTIMPPRGVQVILAYLLGASAIPVGFWIDAQPSPKSLYTYVIAGIVCALIVLVTNDYYKKRQSKKAIIKKQEIIQHQIDAANEWQAERDQERQKLRAAIDAAREQQPPGTPANFIDWTGENAPWRVAPSTDETRPD